jgi:pyruvate kinase
MLEAFANDAFGPPARPGTVRVMVTMPSDAADDPSVIDGLIQQGMTVMRVNCAHDGPAAWARMVDHLRTAQARHGSICKVAFDLAGPKLRTGSIAPGPEVVRCRPVRDTVGRTVAQARMRFFPADAAMTPTAGLLPLDPRLCSKARVGDTLHLEDAGGRARILRVMAAEKAGLLCFCDRTVYFTTGTRVELFRKRRLASGPIGTLPAKKGGISLSVGDTLVIGREPTPGHAASTGDKGEVEPATISCSLADVFERVQPGHRVMLDDGKFEGVIKAVAPTAFQLELTRAGRGTALLKAEKGLNFPDTPLELPALTSKDLEDLEFIVQYADLVSLSFVHRSEDVDSLYQQLERLRATDVGVILKVENRTAFEHVPELLLTAARRPRIAVMIARGDLGVEVGFGRLAEVQEEMIWLCEAAQVPVIWATQVLESLAKNGLPSRAEVTDAAMSVRAECVMLNKGPHIGHAVRFLNDVSLRMHEHSQKTFATHRALKVAATDWLEVDRTPP